MRCDNEKFLIHLPKEMLRYSAGNVDFEGCSSTKPMKYKVVSSKAFETAHQKPKNYSKTKEITNNIN